MVKNEYVDRHIFDIFDVEYLYTYYTFRNGLYVTPCKAIANLKVKVNVKVKVKSTRV